MPDPLPASSPDAAGSPDAPAPSPASDDDDRMPAPTEAKRLHPMTLLQRVIRSLPALAFVLLPALTSPDARSWFSIFFGITYGAVALPAIVLKYWRFSYRITPNEIVIQSGVLTRKNRSIPIERVQNIQIEQSLLPRATGTAKVKIETAGSASTEGVLEYVSLEEAHHIRQVIRSYKRQQSARHAEPDTPSAAPSEDAAAPEAPADVLFRMPLRRVLLSGAFRFSLLYIALIFSVIEAFNPNPDTVARWLTRGQMEGLVDAAAQSPWLAGIGTVLVAGLLAWLTGIAINLNKYYDFQLWREGDKLRFRRGLLTLSEGTIPLKKVQALILRTNPVMRYFGWYALEVQTVGLNVEEQGHRVIVPFAQYKEALALAQEVRAFEMPEHFASVSPLTIRRHFFRYSIVLLTGLTLLGGLAWWFGAPWQDVLWGLVGLPFILGYAYLFYRHHEYAIGEDGLYVRRGVVKQYAWVIPTEKFHVFYTTASFFQQRLGLRSLFVDTAGAATFAYPDIIDLPAAAARDGQHQLHNQFHRLYQRRLEAAPGGASPHLPAHPPSLPEDEVRTR